MTITGSTLALTPGTRQAPGTGPNTGPRTGRSSRYQDAADSARARAGDGYFAWLDHIWHAAACTRPIRLHGHVRHIDAATGELLRDIATDTMPDKVVYKPCGNRSASACPGCAETYRRDAYHLIRAGLIGGKGITPTVAAHPAVFVTLHRPVIRAGARPPGPPAHLHRQDPLPVPAAALPRPP